MDDGAIDVFAGGDRDGVTIMGGGERFGRQFVVAVGADEEGGGRWRGLRPG